MGFDGDALRDLGREREVEALAHGGKDVAVDG